MMQCYAGKSEGGREMSERSADPDLSGLNVGAAQIPIYPG